MKFAKRLLSEIVPEWQYQYIDYKKLKLLIKEMQPVADLESSKKRPANFIFGSSKNLKETSYSTESIQKTGSNNSEGGDSKGICIYYSFFSFICPRDWIFVLTSRRTRKGLSIF